MVVEMTKLQENMKKRFADADELLNGPQPSDAEDRPTTVSAIVLCNNIRCDIIMKAKVRLKKFVDSGNMAKNRVGRSDFFFSLTMVLNYAN